MLVRTTLISSPDFASIVVTLNFIWSLAVISITRGPAAAGALLAASVAAALPPPAAEVSFWPQPDNSDATKSGTDRERNFISNGTWQALRDMQKIFALEKTLIVFRDGEIAGIMA